MTNHFRVGVLTLCALLRAGAVAQAQTWDEEFVGPFPSWVDAKTAYGAAGDGLTDDTAALQQALDALGTAGQPSVLYLPAGTYRITSTLSISAREQVSVIGADPATTRLRWAGASGGTLFSVAGVARSRFNRLTFDGASIAAVLVDQAWSCSGSYFDTANEYADDVFKDAGTGLRGGANGCGFAETSVWRSEFLRLSTAGIALKNFNALDLWVWYSKFENCNVGVTNHPGAGNFHVYNSYFRRSVTADMFIKNTGVFNIRNNTSIGSAAFFDSPESFRYPATVTLQGNAISTTAATPIFVGNQGPVSIIDNILVTAKSAAPIAVGYNGVNGADGDALVVGNQRVSKVANVIGGRAYQIDNTQSSGLSVSAPTLPGFTPRRNRKVFDVGAGASAATIQQAINGAVAAKSRAVVHLSEGEYAIDTTLVVPANADIQVVGDGERSVLRWTGAGGGPVLRVSGPTYTVLRDFSVNGNGGVDGISVERADQSGSRLYLNQVQLGGGQIANLSVAGMDRLVVDARDIGHGPSPNTSVVVAGGSLSAAGSSKATAKVNIFSGASCCITGTAYRLSNGGKLLVRDMWYEGGSGAVPWASVSGRGPFTLAGSRVSVSAANPAISFSDFTGRGAVLSGGIDSWLDVSGNTTGALIYGFGLLFPSGLSPLLNDTSGSPHTVMTQHWRSQISGGSSVPVADGAGITAANVRNGLAHTRAEKPGVIGRLSSGTTDLRLYRVTSVNTAVGLRVTP